MRKHTQRQLNVWMVWLEMQLNTPDRTAYYLAQIASEVRRSFVKKPEDVKTSSFIMKFEINNIKKRMVQQSRESPKLAIYDESSEAEEPTVTIDKEQAARVTAISKSVWFTRLGLTPDGKGGVKDGSTNNSRARTNRRETRRRDG